MQPFHTAETQGEDVTSWVSVCPRGLWEVRCRRTREAGQALARHDHIGEDKQWSPYDCPRMGALCWVRVWLKGNPQTGTSTTDQGDKELSIKSDMPTPELTEAQAMQFPRSRDSVLQVPLGDWIVLRLGEGQCDVTEACVEGMRAGESCEVQLTPLRDEPKDQPSESGAGQEGLRVPNQHLHVTIELHSFTPSRASWEMPVEEKWHWIGSHKERGGDRFRSGDVWGAADSYSRALKLLITLHGQLSGEEEREGETKGQEEERDKETSDKTQELPRKQNPLAPTEKEYQTIKAELHSNLSLCQIKLHQPERARASAAKATQLEPSGAKAWYRLGQACLEVAELGEARRAFRKLLELQPDSPSAQKGLKEVGSRERERDQQLGQRLSKMFS